VLWDYHVVLFARGPATTSGSGWEVWDLDCDVGMPLSLRTWLRASFSEERARAASGEAVELDAEASGFAPRFRVVAAAEFVELFSSDRSHMLDEAGRPLRDFPSWAPIQGRPAPGARASTNLMRFVDMTAPFAGDVLTLDQLRRAFDSK
jgi:hypothetical protein